MCGVSSVYNDRIPNFPSCPWLCLDMRFICFSLNHKFRDLRRELQVGIDLDQRELGSNLDRFIIHIEWFCLWSSLVFLYEYLSLHVIETHNLWICRSQWPRGLRRRSSATRLLRLWVRIPLGHVCLSVVSVVCCHVEVSATDWSLVQGSPTDCGASLCMIKKPRKRGG